MAVDIWAFRATVEEVDLSGYTVAATDGDIGHVDKGEPDDGEGSIVVDTGPLVFGRKVLLPLGTIARVDPEERKVYVDRTKDEIRHAPEYDPSGYADQEYRVQLSEYYARFYE